MAAAFVYPLVPLGFQSLCTANLTNVIGQALFSIGLLWIVARGSRARSITTVGVGAGLVAAGFLSHFSTIAVGVPLAAAVAGSLVFGAPDARRTACVLAAALAIAIVLSYALYYSRFHEVYAQTAARVAAREGAGDRHSMAAPPSAKAAFYVLLTRGQFGLPLLVTAGAGLVVAIARHRREAMVRTLLAWILTLAGFAALGILTPIEMRASLAAIPAVSGFAAFAIPAASCRRGAAGRVVASAASLAIVATAVRAWASCLVGSP